MNTHALVLALSVPLILLSLYRRFRRNFGRQPVMRKRMIVRIVILAIAAVAILTSVTQTAPFIEAAAAGFAAGIALAFVGLRLTTFEATPEGEFYTPNVYLGVTLSALLIGRLIYRFVIITPTMQDATRAAPGNPYDSFQRSPLTLALFTLLIGYYVTYSAGVLLRLHRDQENPS